MKSRKLFLVMTLVFGMMLIGCPDEPEPTYRVWTNVTTYSQFSSTFNGSLDDGYYGRAELNASQWNEISPQLTSEGRHYWTESQIKKWFIGRGFADSVANQQTAWLLTVNHGFIASRTVDIVYMILK